MASEQDRFQRWMTAGTNLDGEAIPAATVILLRDTPAGVETLMLRRNSKLAFGGMWVFPGGRVDPTDHEGAVDADLLEEGKRNLQERLERDGYFDAEVDYETDTHKVKSSGKGWQGAEEVITYTVERGERHKLIGIEITGNRYFDAELLRSRLQIFGGAFASRGRFSRRLVESAP